MADPMTTEEFNQLLAEALTDPREVTLRSEGQRIDLIVNESLTISFHSAREDPEVTIKGDTAFATGSRITVTQDGEEREVETGDMVSLELPADPIRDQLEEAP